MKNFIKILVILFGVGSLYAQQTPQFTQYLFNPTSINPAFAGSAEGLSAILMNRSQWTDFENAPSTQSVSIHAPLSNKKVGVGISFIKDDLGNENFMYFNGDFSYALQLNEKVRLALGLKAGVTNYSLSGDFLSKPDVQNDPYFSEYSESWKPNFGVGSYLYSERWYVGLSATQLFSNELLRYPDDEMEFRPTETTGVYLTGGYEFNLVPNVVLKPTTMLRFSNSQPMYWDLGTNFIFNDKFWLGINYRFNDFDTIGTLASFNFWDNLNVGYAYEFPVTDFGPIIGGTHEFFLSYNLF